MPYSTITAGTTITASWANSNVRDQVITPFASAGARDSAIPSPIEGQHVYLTDTDKTMVYNGAAWVPAVSGSMVRQILTSGSAVYSASGATDFTISNVVVRAERLYRVHFHSAFQVLVGGTTRYTVQLFVDGVDTDRLADVSTATSLDSQFDSAILWLPTSGTKVIEARVVKVAGTGSISFPATATATRQFYVEDAGPR